MAAAEDMLLSMFARYESSEVNPDQLMQAKENSRLETSCVTATPDFETLVTTKRMEAAWRAIDGRMMFGRTEEACRILQNGSSAKSQSKRKRKRWQVSNPKY